MHVKIGLVTPYIYPLPGGVNAHVTTLREPRRARPRRAHHQQRPRPAAPSEGDIIRLGYGFSVPDQRLSRHADLLAALHAHRPGQMLEEEHFDMLHFHEPFVPFLSLVLLRESQSINIATFHAYAGWSPAYEFGKRMLSRFARRLNGRIAVSAAARHFVESLLPGRLQGHPQRRRPAPLPERRSRSRATRTARSTSSSSAGSRAARALMYLLKAYRQLRKSAATTAGCCSSVRVRRSARSAATSPRAA